MVRPNLFDIVCLVGGLVSPFLTLLAISSSYLLLPLTFKVCGTIILVVLLSLLFLINARARKFGWYEFNPVWRFFERFVPFRFLYPLLTFTTMFLLPYILLNFEGVYLANIMLVPTTALSLIHDLYEMKRAARDV